MNKKGFEIAISMFVLIVIGIFVLIGLILFVRKGFDDLDEGVKPFIESTEVIAVKESCQISCTVGSKFSFCCGNYTVENRDVRCYDPRLGVSCSLNCEDFTCG